MIKKQVCKVCNCNFDIKISKKYLVKVGDFLGTKNIFDAYDCPQCGCQQLISQRYHKVITTVKNENEINR